MINTLAPSLIMYHDENKNDLLAKAVINIVKIIMVNEMLKVIMTYNTLIENNNLRTIHMLKITCIVIYAIEDHVNSYLGHLRCFIASEKSYQLTKDACYGMLGKYVTTNTNKPTYKVGY